MSEITHRLTDERMCWLAVREYCRKRSASAASSA